MSRHTDAANAAPHSNSKPAIDWTAVLEREHITSICPRGRMSASTEEFRSQYMCIPLPSSFAG